VSLREEPGKIRFLPFRTPSGLRQVPLQVTPEGVANFSAGPEKDPDPRLFQNPGGLSSDVAGEHGVHISSGYDIPGSRSPGRSLHAPALVRNSLELQGPGIDDHVEAATAEPGIDKIVQFPSGGRYGEFHGSSPLPGKKTPARASPGHPVPAVSFVVNTMKRTGVQDGRFFVPLLSVGLFFSDFSAKFLDMIAVCD